MADAALDSSSRDRAARLLTTLEQLLAIEATEVEAALNQAAHLVHVVLAADKVDIFILDPSSATLVALGTSDTPLAHLQVSIGMHRMPLANRGRTILIFEQGTPFYTGHSEDDPEELIGVKVGLGIRSTLAVPLDVNHERRGVLSVTSTQPDHFAESDLRFLTAVARWIGMVMYRAELVEHLTRTTAEEVRRTTATELITTLAHDLRVPLAPLRGYLGMIRSQAERDQLPAYLQYVQRAERGLARVDAMLSDLLDTARLDQGMFDLSLAVIDVVALVQETVADMRTPQALIEVEAPAECLLVGDAARLRQALENLISNALKWTAQNTTVTVTVELLSQAGQEYVGISVRDHGPGIPADLMPRLFDRFATGSRKQGLGLGLYLARGIAEAHHGILTAESVAGSGAIFRLLLPYPALSV